MSDLDREIKQVPLEQNGNIKPALPSVQDQLALVTAMVKKAYCEIHRDDPLPELVVAFHALDDRGKLRQELHRLVVSQSSDPAQVREWFAAGLKGYCKFKVEGTGTDVRRNHPLFPWSVFDSPSKDPSKK